MLDSLDLQLLNALQIAPRASWSTLAPVLRTDPSTLSRRWTRLTREGLAWTTAYVLPERMQAHSPTGQRLRASSALVEIRCEAGRRSQVTDAIAREAAVMTIECTSGPRELAVTIAASTPGQIDEYVSTAISVLPGVTATSTHFIRRIYREGSEYELDMLSASQRHALDETVRSGSGVGPTPPSELTEQVIRALQPDVRRPAAEVADEIGVSVPLARRTIARLAQSDWVRMRADFAHEVVGWHASVVLWLVVPPHALDSVAAELSRNPSVRLCASTLGPANLAVTLWLHELDELDGIEVRLRHLFPDVRVSDRWMLPRVVKRLGTLFDAQGRRSGYVSLLLPRVTPG
ncbi:Lrp/AsnC family transcriptional regulator [Microbacterium sp. No. 7]|uniref:Lrp/AsnC family transcriptional regulator n=1 Tax=Microbacterium sp. No. 7 TaxID=1714373 RepID=UPI0006D140EF|nr:Lrp/AsnC family transcriptional regulator [Microbacterium sp. No. 7]ALJ20418.1 hypothetical protein AOA12_11085 [Microbacterium sp. No. 7]